MEIEGERLGLGTNLFSSTQTLTERFGVDIEKREIKKKSKLMEELASLDENKQELLIREGKRPRADARVGEYDSNLGVLPVKVLSFKNVINGVANVMLSVWHEEDQSDMQWIQMSIQEDSSYYADIVVSDFGNKLGDYNIHVYVIDGAGEQYKVAEMVGNVSW